MSVTNSAVADHLHPYLVSPAAYLNNEGSVDVTVAHLVASTVVIHSGQVLLLQRANKNFLPYLWEIPGGKCDTEDETVVASAARELREETGLSSLEVKDVVARHEWLDHGEKWKSVIFLMGFANMIPIGNIKVSTVPREHASHLWASYEEVSADKCGDIVLTWASIEHKEAILNAFKVIESTGRGHSNA